MFWNNRKEQSAVRDNRVAVEEPVELESMSGILDRVIREADTTSGLKDVLLSERSELEKSNADYSARLGELLGCEADARQRLETRKSANVRRIVEIDRELAWLEVGYPRIDLAACLRMRDGEGLPRLVPFSLEWGRFKMSVAIGETSGESLRRLMGLMPSLSTSTHQSIWPAQPPKSVPVQDWYRDVMNKLGKRFNDLYVVDGQRRTGSNISLTYSLPGVIPPDARKIINEAVESKAFDEVFIVADVTGQAKIQEERFEFVVPDWIDPLVIGAKDGGFFVLAKFDTTTLEEYLASEHSA